MIGSDLREEGGFLAVNTDRTLRVTSNPKRTLGDKDEKEQRTQSSKWAAAKGKKENIT